MDLVARPSLYFSAAAEESLRRSLIMSDLSGVANDMGSWNPVDGEVQDYLNSVLSRGWQMRRCLEIWEISRRSAYSRVFRCDCECATFVLRFCRQNSPALETALARFRHYLCAHQVPGPAPVLAKSGRGCFEADGLVFSLTPWIEGVAFDWDGAWAWNAGRMLARFHQAAEFYPGAAEIDSLQGEVYPWDRHDWRQIRSIAERSGAEFDRVALQAIAIVDHLERELRLPANQIPMQLGHFDWHPKNLIFDCHGVIIGVLDYDLVRVSERARDIAIGMHRFGFVSNAGTGLRRGTAVTGQTNVCCSMFLQGYESINPLRNEERFAIPWLLYDETRRKIHYILAKHYLERNHLSDFDLEKQASVICQVKQMASILTKSACIAR